MKTDHGTVVCQHVSIASREKTYVWKAACSMIIVLLRSLLNPEPENTRAALP